jgi:hypothetical protein
MPELEGIQVNLLMYANLQCNNLQDTAIDANIMNPLRPLPKQVQ